MVLANLGNLLPIRSFPMVPVLNGKLENDCECGNLGRGCPFAGIREDGISILLSS